MSEKLDLGNVVEDSICSYAARIQTLGSMLDGTHLILNSFQESLIDSKEERGKVNTELQDILAENEHLRRKDFDKMMQGLLLTQDKAEKETRGLLKDYLDEQKEMAQTLTERLGEFRDSLAKGEVERVREFQIFMKGYIADQDRRKDEVVSKLKEFQEQQQKMAKRLKELLAKGRELRIRDLKAMLKEFSRQHKERIARTEERRQEVRNMLDGFRSRRMEAVGEKIYKKE